MAPFAIMAWSKALEYVDQSPTRRVSESEGRSPVLYLLPDPALLCSDSPRVRAKNVESWLRMRENWLFLLTLKPSMALSKQSWRDFLAVDPSSDWWNKGSDADAKRRQRIHDLLAPQHIDNVFFAGIQTRSTTGTAMVWQGQGYEAGKEPPLVIFREIIWELCERSFRCELVLLDRRACANLDVHNPDKLFERQELISKCIVDSSVDVVSIPSSNLGLAANDFRARLPFILALVTVMRSWKGDKPATFSLASQPIYDFSETQALHLEEAVAMLYAQTSFNYFGRAPFIPYRLYSI